MGFFNGELEMKNEKVKSKIQISLDPVDLSFYKLSGIINNYDLGYDEYREIVSEILNEIIRPMADQLAEEKARIEQEIKDSIVLPTTTTLERNDIGFRHWEQTVSPMHKAIDPVGNSKHDFDIFSLISEKLDFKKQFTENKNEEI